MLNTFVAVGVLAAGAVGQPCPPVIGPGYTSLPFSSGVSGRIYAVAVDTTGPEPTLLVAGNFAVVESGEVIRDLARWDGAAWSRLEGGLTNAGNLAFFDGHVYASSGGAVHRLQDGSWVELEGVSTGSWDAAFHVLDRGAGPALYISGNLTVGGVETPAAVWTGSDWENVGVSTPDVGRLEDLVALGSDLYGLAPLRLARLEDGQWSLEEEVRHGAHAIAAFDDGSGDAIYIGAGKPSVAGRFDGTSLVPDSTLLGVNDFMTRSEAGVDVLYALRREGSDRLTVRRFAGGEWADVGEVVGRATQRPKLADLSSFSAPDALALVGLKGTVHGEIANEIIEYAAGDWRPLGQSAPPHVLAMESGEVSRLAVEAVLDGSTAVRQFAVDDGSGLRPAGELAGEVHTIRTVTLDGARQTFVAGALDAIDGELISGVARWTESGFEQFGAAIRAYGAEVYAIEAFDGGAGDDLYVGGIFSTFDNPPANSITRWTGAGWDDLHGGVDGDWPFVAALATFDDGSGPALYVGGRFQSAGGVAAAGLARWDGEQWSAVAGGPSGLVSQLRVVEIGGAPVLLAAGAFELPALEPGEQTMLATWDGQTWRPFGHTYDTLEADLWSPFRTPIHAMTPLVVDGRLIVYVNGHFELKWGSERVIYSALFDGERWRQLWPHHRVLTSAVTPDGKAIAVGGLFATFDGELQPGLATITPCTCPADLDGDGALTFFDFLAFQNLFAAGDLRADFDEDGELTFFDFLAFQNEFAAGCV